jgi:hypothetical protein
MKVKWFCCYGHRLDDKNVGCILPVKYPGSFHLIITFIVTVFLVLFYIRQKLFF